uniref:Uncharacterized protein n=1 Tax=Arion vulgaris TaxID=1028688 RepID=A0A0B7ALC7_9EUPU
MCLLMRKWIYNLTFILPLQTLSVINLNMVKESSGQSSAVKIHKVVVSRALLKSTHGLSQNGISLSLSRVHDPGLD